MTSKIFSLYIFVIVLSLCVGCAQVGKRFNYENRAQLMIGHTTKDEAVGFLGKPYRSTNVSKNDRNFDIFQYTYAFGSLRGAAARVLFLEFADGTLNCYIYNSAFPEDSTDFSLDSFRNIKKGIHTRTDVQNIFGEPCGKCVCPTSLVDYSGKCENGKEVWAWMFTSPSKGLNTNTIKSKSVFLIFDENGIVTNTDMTKEN